MTRMCWLLGKVTEGTESFVRKRVKGEGEGKVRTPSLFPPLHLLLLLRSLQTHLWLHPRKVSQHAACFWITTSGLTGGVKLQGEQKKKKKRKRKGKPPERDGDHSLASLLQKLRMWSSNCLLISQGKLNKCAGGTINLYFLKMGAEILVFGPHRAPHESRR